MADKHDRKKLPAGYDPAGFIYQGRPARDQGDFGNDVGIADMACVDQFGETDTAKYYHAGVVRHTKDNSWWVYLQWGRITSGKSWQGSTFVGNDFQFVQCSGEPDARKFFASQCSDKNTKRLEQKSIGGKTIWAGKAGKDGYIVQRLATRERGLPDAYGIKDATGIQTPPGAAKTAVVTGGGPAAPKPAPKAPGRVIAPQVAKLATDLTGGTVQFARQRAADAGGSLPTLDAITEVRDQMIPTALGEIKRIGPDVHKQVGDSRLIDLSKYVWGLVPKPISRSNDAFERAAAAILNADNILALQADLDAYEAALKAESFDLVVDDRKGPKTVDADAMLNARLTWLAPGTAEYQWVAERFNSMHNNRHHYRPHLLNLFEVVRPDRDAQFLNAVASVAARRNGKFGYRAGLQPRTRPDLAQHGDSYGLANVVFMFHGTRTVNVTPIVQTHFRLPKQLSGVPIAGANFGHGTYFASDRSKSIGYTSSTSAYWSGGDGGIRGRGAMMFACDMIMGDAYLAPSTGSWTSPPDGKDSIFGRGGDPGHRLKNDEYIIFNPNYSRIRYIIEFNCW